MIERAVAVLAGVLAIAMVAGCGGGGDDSTDAGSEVTKAAFIKEADAICEAGDKALNSELEAFAKENKIEGEPDSTQAVEISEEIVIPNIKQQGEEIGDLTTPEGDEETVSEIVDSLANGVSEAESDPGGLFEGEVNPFGDATKKAKAYGMKSCGQE